MCLALIQRGFFICLSANKEIGLESVFSSFNRISHIFPKISVFPNCTFALLYMQLHYTPIYKPGPITSKQNTSILKVIFMEILFLHKILNKYTSETAGTSLPFLHVI